MEFQITELLKHFDSFIHAGSYFSDNSFN